MRFSGEHAFDDFGASLGDVGEALANALERVVEFFVIEA